LSLSGAEFVGELFGVRATAYLHHDNFVMPKIQRDKIRARPLSIGIITWNSVLRNDEHLPAARKEKCDKCVDCVHAWKLKEKRCVRQGGASRSEPLPISSAHRFLEFFFWSRLNAHKVSQKGRGGVILFFWPMRASSWNQSSSGLPVAKSHFGSETPETRNIDISRPALSEGQRPTSSWCSSAHTGLISPNRVDMISDPQPSAGSRVSTIGFRFANQEGKFFRVRTALPCGLGRLSEKRG